MVGMNKNKSLGQNPLASGIFSKTIESSVENLESNVKSLDSRTRSSEASDTSLASINQESGFLIRSQSSLMACNVRLPETLIDWLDNLVKSSSRDRQRARIPKEVWVQAALEYFKALPLDWNNIKDENDLRKKLEDLSKKV